VTRLGALLLAAGGSTRMRRPKLLLPWGEGLQQTVIGASLNALLGAPVEWIGLVTGALGDAVGRRARTAYRLWVAPENAEKPFLRVIHNPAWEEGMRRSIVTGLAALPPHLTGVFIALGDMPAVPPTAYELLTEAFAKSPERIYRAAYQGRPGHPVLFPRALVTEIEPIGDEGLRAVLHRHQEKVRLVEVADPGVLLDLDTPESYRALGAAAGAGRGISETALPLMMAGRFHIALQSVDLRAVSAELASRFRRLVMRRGPFGGG
jgi:molybdenum cofactor cytidylyltransferase